MGMGNSQGKPVEFDGEGMFHFSPIVLLLHSWQRRMLTFAFSLTVNLNHFRLLRVVGRGAFGKVRIVERKDTGLAFALKYIRKDDGKSASSPLAARPGH